jgi:membrane associated rhomboid family serine protease
MGFEDRQYSRDDSIYSESLFGGTPYGASRRRGGLASVSIVMILIGINVIIWLLDAFTPKTESGHLLSDFLSLQVDSLWKVWSFLTYGFAHAPIDSSTGIWHILGNMLILFFLGRPVAERLGRYEFLRFYLTAIVVSAFAFVAWCLLFQGGKGIVGASGAVSAVFILFVFWYPNQKLLVWGILPVPAWILGLLLVGGDFLRAFDKNSMIAWQAHLGGAAFAASYFYFGWHLGWMGRLTEKMPKPKGKLNVYDPDAEEARPSKADKIKEEGDRILRKISEEGEASLTRRERKTLEQYSRELRNRQ